MTTPVDVNPGGSGACSEPCNMCCTLHKSVKTFTRLKNGSPVNLTCTKLFWNCTCNGERLIMQRQISGVWTDFESSWFSPTSNWWYPPPRQVPYNCRIKCVLPGGFTYYSNVISVDATWQCHCDDGLSLRTYRIDVDGTFTYTSGINPGSTISWTESHVVGAINSSGWLASVVSGYVNVMGGGFVIAPMPTNKLVIHLMGMYLPGDDATHGSYGTWQLDLGLGNPCTQIAPCTLAGAMSFCGGCPLVTGNQQYWVRTTGTIPAPYYVGYNTIDAVNAVLLTGC